MKQILSITKKELESFFGSPMALIFVGAYLAVTLFVFFWGEAFWSRGIADVRPLFRWTPVLMIFLVAALTMRQWSEEQRAGTLEVLMTLPVSPTQLVLGKFLAVMAEVALALALTLSLPITVALVGNLDWGPVVGGYLASLLLAGAYTAIGLFVSSRTDNQIVALIATVLVAGLFYLAGSPGVTGFVGEGPGTVLRALGSGSRFESIERGVVDLRDLIYYLSLTAVFLVLNVFSLDAKRWSEGEATRSYRQSASLTALLLALNLVLLNVWIYPLRGLRLDLTEQREYTLSPTTRELVTDLREPLLIRGYFSERTHPLLAPLVSRIRDMLQEYAVASGGDVIVEVIDPVQNPELEAEAAQQYGIRPTPFQVAGRYEQSIINSYFDILVRYGDQNVVLNFRDLIEVQPRRDGTVDVNLRNLEYDLTRAVKKVVYGFQSVDAVLAAMDAPVELTLYVTPDTLPEWLQAAPDAVATVAQEIASQSDGRLTYRTVNPTAPDSGTSADALYETYGIQPYAAGLFGGQTYYLHVVLTAGDQTQVVYPGGDMAEADIRRAVESALKRLSPGFLSVVGIWTPTQPPPQAMQGQMEQPISSWNQVQEVLRQEYEVRAEALEDGAVSDEVDVLVVIAPQDMSDRERYAIDQYLMRGGSVVLAAGNYGIVASQMTGGLALKPLENGVQPLLDAYGIEVEEALVMDPQNEPFPVTVNRNVGGFAVQEIQSIAYPFFVDVRPDGMATESPVVSNLPAVTLPWASPLNLDEAANAEREVTELLRSSAGAWLQTDTNIQPDFEQYPELGFAQAPEVAQRTLAVSVQGVFPSAFADQPNPLLEPAEGETEPPADAAVTGTIEASPASSRLIVVGSSEFVDDVVFDISSRLTMDRYLNSLKLMQNSVAWATEDADLLEIRARGNYTRLLSPMTEETQSFFEIANYVVALAALVLIGYVWSARRQSQEPMELLPRESLPAGESA